MNVAQPSIINRVRQSSCFPLIGTRSSEESISQPIYSENLAPVKRRVQVLDYTVCGIRFYAQRLMVTPSVFGGLSSPPCSTYANICEIRHSNDRQVRIFHQSGVQTLQQPLLRHQQRRYERAYSSQLVGPSQLGKQPVEPYPTSPRQVNLHGRCGDYDNSTMEQRILVSSTTTAVTRINGIPHINRPIFLGRNAISPSSTQLANNSMVDTPTISFMRSSPHSIHLTSPLPITLFPCTQSKNTQLAQLLCTSYGKSTSSILLQLAMKLTTRRTYSTIHRYFTSAMQSIHILDIRHIRFAHIYPFIIWLITNQKSVSPRDLSSFLSPINTRVWDILGTPLYYSRDKALEHIRSKLVGYIDQYSICLTPRKTQNSSTTDPSLLWATPPDHAPPRWRDMFAFLIWGFLTGCRGTQLSNTCIRNAPNDCIIVVHDIPGTQTYRIYHDYGDRKRHEPTHARQHEIRPITVCW